MTLNEILLLITAGGGGGIVFWFMENINAIKALRPDYKRYISWALSAAVPLSAWGLMLLFGYEAAPVSWRAGGERVFALLWVAFTANQGIHAVVVLRKKGAA